MLEPKELLMTIIRSSFGFSLSLCVVPLSGVFALLALTSVEILGIVFQFERC
jgi:hypothetical protein